ncbi:hypothetical protein NY78_4267 [Desulfovibrio sp. TomC]|nr:hypothetical protein NY78_4267 [Desulfovibrio sp. TomC]
MEVPFFFFNCVSNIFPTNDHTTTTTGDHLEDSTNYSTKDNSS